MSSEGSVVSGASRIRQFGLYRTIDARTEEFLRSSRKRQIRQGCACAAISTAITVTVVVSVILVYEYSINSHSNANKKISTKPNWFGLMNESDITSLGTKFNKKINFDRTTLKLLPILLKALNKNRYLEKILEDYSSSSPPYVGKDSTEATFTKNVFSDSKNWLKIPTSRLYTADYKTSPLGYWKSPTQRLEYLTKIRKIRDYQRMLNYFDKMINDKVGSNQKKDFEFTENPLIAETVPMKKDKIKKIQDLRPLETIKNLKEFRSESTEDTNNCKCPKKMGQLLSKLISSIQDMIPHMINNKLSSHKCANETKVTTKRPCHMASLTQPKLDKLNEFPETVSMSLNREMLHKMSKRLTTLGPKLITFTRKSTSTGRKTSSVSPSSTTSSTSTYTTSTSASTTARITPTTPVSSIRTSERTTEKVTKSTTASSTLINTLTTTESNYFDDSLFNKNTIHLPTISNTIMPIFQAYEKSTLDYDSIFKPTDFTRLETTKSPQKQTTMFVPIKFIDSNSNEVRSNEKLLDTYTVQSPNSRHNMPLYKDEEYDDLTTTSKPGTSFENLDVHSMEVLKTKMSVSNDNEYETRNTLKKGRMNSLRIKYHSVTPPADFDLYPMRKMADFIYLPQEKKTNEWKYNLDPKLTELNLDSKLRSRLQAQSIIEINSVENNTSITDNINYYSSLKNINNITNPTSDVKLNNGETTLSGENLVDEEFQDEFGYKQPERSTAQPYKYKNSTKIRTIEENPSNAWEMLKKEEKVTVESSKSMLPSMRPLYLEVQRNSDWRQDEHADYDINFNNNIFDLPNIN